MKDIDKLLRSSQSNFRNGSSGKTNSSRESDRRNNKYGKNRNDSDSILDDLFGDDFVDQFEKGILEAFLGSDFDESIKSIFQGFADDIAGSISDIPKQLGQTLGHAAFEAFKNSSIGKPVVDKFEDFKTKAASSLRDDASKFANWYNDVNASDPYRKNDDFKKEAAKKVAEQEAKKAAEKTAQQSAASVGEDVASSAASAEGAAAAQSAATSGAASASSAGAATGAAGSAVAGGAAAAAGTGESAALVASTGEAAMAAEGAGTAFAGAASTIGAACPYILAAIAAVIIVTEILKYTFGPALEGTKKLFEGLKKAANRYQESMKANTEAEKKRIQDDVETMVRAPFDILEAAAQELYDAWDADVRTINATQGYNKDDLYDLIGSFADRLRSEGLSSVISSADITSNLSKVLQSGLSGPVAEEFAYIATKLNAAIPTQDFFGYAETYASIAAQQIALGKSQSDAVAYANAQLELFASDVLYASRQLSGGFSTGLNSASDLFTKAVQIAQAARTGEPSQIAGVLTAVSSITGAIAPDLANTITDAIVSAATGGNNSSIVALRSLAGINASNTEFLRQLAQDPKKVFTTLFTNLATMQNMSQDAYMEVAEGLSDVFGLSMDAFARVDFNYLAQAIDRMNVDNSALLENVELLASGETTTNQEALRMQQINKYMIDEGLAYVLDNQTARSIQEHMWDEQIARELMEAEYAVSLRGSALDFLDGIKTTIDRILNFLNPIGALIKKFTNISATIAEGVAQDADIRQLLELGKLGNGNVNDLYNLTTRGQALHLVSSIVDLMGGHSAYGAVSSFTQGFNSLAWGSSRSVTMRRGLDSLLTSAIQYALTSYTPANVGSTYKWGTLGKSAASLPLSIPTSSSNVQYVSASNSSASTLSTAVAQKLSEMMTEDYMKSIIDANTSTDIYGHKTVNATFDDWLKSANSKGISNIDKSLEAYGYNRSEIEKAFEDLASNTQAQASAAEENELKAAQLRFYKEGGQFDTYWEDIKESQENIIELIGGDKDSVIYLLDNFKTSFDSFAKSWTDYWINHTTYDDRWDSSEVDKIKNKKQTDTTDAVYALAKALTSGLSDLTDPTVQTNTLLGQILIVVNAIMQQNNQTGAGLSLPDTLSALAMGLIK